VDQSINHLIRCGGALRYSGNEAWEKTQKGPPRVRPARYSQSPISNNAGCQTVIDNACPLSPAILFNQLLLIVFWSTVKQYIVASPPCLMFTYRADVCSAGCTKCSVHLLFLHSRTNVTWRTGRPAFWCCNVAIRRRAWWCSLLPLGFPVVELLLYSRRLPM